VNVVLSTLKKILFWSYDRGTWQYDVLCVLILAFILLAPNRVFNRNGRSTPDHAVATRQFAKGEHESHTAPDPETDKGKSLPEGSDTQSGGSTR